MVASTLVPLSLPQGGQQSYRRLSLKFAPLTYNMNTVERRSLVSATAVGGTVFMLVSGSLSSREKLESIARARPAEARRGSAKAMPSRLHWRPRVRIGLL